MSEKFDSWECSSIVDEPYFGAISQWPEMHRLSALAAVDRLMRRYPDAKIVKEMSECIAGDHSRFPEGVDKRKYVLVHTIYLDCPVE